MAAATGYSFPPVVLSEIVTVVRDWGLGDVQQDKISSCDPQTIQHIYSFALQRVTGITLDKIDDTADNLSSEPDEYGDICVGGTSLNILLHQVQRMCFASKIPGFALKDLVQPERARTMEFLSAIINFVKFTEEQQEFVRNLQIQSNKVTEEQDRLNIEIQSMRKQIDSIKAQRHAEEPECADLKGSISHATAEMTTTKEVQSRMIGDVDKVKREKAAVIERKIGIRNEIMLAKEKLDKTRSRIVNDPERLRRLLETKASLVQDEKSSILSNDSKSRSLQAKLDSLAVFEQDIRLNVQHLQTTEIEQNHLEMADRKLQDIRAMLEQKNIERSELLATLDRSRRQLENAAEKLERAQRNAEERRNAAKSTTSRLQKEYEEMAVERRDNDKQVEETKRQAEEVEKRMAEHLKKNETEMNELLAQYFRLRHQTELYMETLANKLSLGENDD